MAQEYWVGVASRLLNLLDSETSMEIRDGGIYLKQEWIDTPKGRSGWLDWTPQSALLHPDRDPRELLPIPFTGKQLAAFLLCPTATGCDLEQSADRLAEAFSGPQDGLPKLAIEEARDHMARAVARSGTNDADALRLNVQRMESESSKARDAARERLGILSVSDHGLSDSEYTRRNNQANNEVAALKAALAEERSRAEALDIDWLRRTTLAIFEDAQPRRIDGETAGFVEGFYRRLSLPAFVQMHSVAPLVAARLLHAKNPMDASTQDDAEVRTLALVFEDVALFAPASRSMWDWVQIARERQVVHNAEIAGYIEFRAAGIADIGQKGKDLRSTPAGEFSTPNAKTVTRQDLLAPLILKAIREVGADTANAFTLIRQWAQTSPPTAPLIGVTESGIQWLDSNDCLQELSRENLRKRISRRQSVHPQTTANHR